MTCPPQTSAEEAPPAAENRRSEATLPLFRSVGFLYGIDANLLEAIATIESNFDPRAVSHRGALGMMQLMPAMAKHFRVENPFDPIESAMGAARFLEYLVKTFEGTALEGDLSALVAAYHAGEGAVFRHEGIPPYSDTREYVRRVLRTYHAKKGTVPPPNEVPTATRALASTPAAKPTAAAEPVRVTEPPSPTVSIHYVAADGSVRLASESRPVSEL